MKEQNLVRDLIGKMKEIVVLLTHLYKKVEIEQFYSRGLTYYIL